MGHVINALSDIEKGKQRHVHYRDSKLTFLLSDSIGGNSRTCLVATVSPSAKSLCETMSTLKFAQRAKLIRNDAQVNEDTGGTIAALQAEIERLRAGQVSHTQATSNLGESCDDKELSNGNCVKLTEALGTQTKVIKSLKRKLQEEQMIRKFKQARIKNFKKKIPSRDEEIELICQEIDSLRRQVDLPSTEAIEWKAAYAKNIDKTTTNPPKLYDPPAEDGNLIKKLKRKVEKLEKENIALEEATEELRNAANDALDELDKQSNDLQFVIDEKTSKIDHLHTKLQNALHQNEINGNRIEVSEKGREKLSIQVEDLEVELEKTLEELEVLNKEKEITAERSLLKEKELTEIVKSKDNASADMKTAEAKLREEIALKSKDNILLLGRVKELTKDLNRKTKELDRLGKKYDTMKSTQEAEILLLQTEVKNLRGKVKEIEMEKETVLRDTAAKFSDEISNLNAANCQLEQDMVNIQASVADEDPRITELQAKLAQVQKERDEIEFEKDLLQENHDTLTDDIHHLTKQNEELDEENAHFRKVIGIESSFGSKVDHPNIETTLSDEIAEEIADKNSEFTVPFELDSSPILKQSKESSSFPKVFNLSLKKNKSLERNTDQAIPLPSSELFTSIKEEHSSNNSLKKTTAKRTPLAEKSLNSKDFNTSTKNPSSTSKSKFQLPYIVQSALEKSKLATPPGEEDDSFDESMFLPNMSMIANKENEMTPMKSSSQSKNLASSLKKKQISSQIFRSGWSFTM